MHTHSNFFTITHFCYFYWHKGYCGHHCIDNGASNPTKIYAPTIQECFFRLLWTPLTCPTKYSGSHYYNRLKVRNAPLVQKSHQKKAHLKSSVSYTTGKMRTKMDEFPTKVTVALQFIKALNIKSQYLSTTCLLLIFTKEKMKIGKS